ncbi:hypothetical protein B0H14DRAFT_2353941 [Mycena olivaceomarginata]|nr:hypothetical protein B0H14DRAFT_2353941 [Mycena olivaceomarginata]
MDFGERQKKSLGDSNSGGRGGSTQADSWEGGKLTRRQCQGVIVCENLECGVVTRPHTRSQSVEKQLLKPCICGANLVHRTCDVRSTLHTFAGGVRYQNGGTHDHPRPTVRLHLGPEESDEFAAIVQQQPKTGPLKLLVGHPTASGPAESVSKISPLLVNADRIKYQRRKVLRGGAGGFTGDHFLKEFAKLQQSHPNFFRSSQFGQVSVIVMQTPFMASRLVKSVAVDTEAVNGIVSDAAHGFWADQNSILIISSTYEPTHLRCWVPGLISYSNGATTEHYRIHFFELFLSIAEETESRAIELIDAIFANVVDFSAAQRSGFIFAYVDFWSQWAPGERDVNELCEAAPKLLKGCRQHFQSQVTRVKKISGVVDPAFPRAESWFQWWMLPSHACMLFPSFRIMTAALWKSIPDSTNAEEAMHLKLYSALGKHLGLLDGLRSLVAFAEYYRTQFDAKKSKLIICTLGSIN